MHDGWCCNWRHYFFELNGCLADPAGLAEFINCSRISRWHIQSADLYQPNRAVAYGTTKLHASSKIHQQSSESTAAYLQSPKVWTEGYIKRITISWFPTGDPVWQSHQVPAQCLPNCPRRQLSSNPFDAFSLYQRSHCHWRSHLWEDHQYHELSSLVWMRSPNCHPGFA